MKTSNNNELETGVAPKKSILDWKMTYFPSIKAQKGVELTFKNFIEGNFQHPYDEHVYLEKLNEAKKNDSLKEFKAELPIITPCTSNLTRSNTEEVIYSGFVTFDIDKISIKQCMDLFGVIRGYDFIAYLSYSASMSGLWGLIPVNLSQVGFKEAANNVSSQLQKLLARMNIEGIVDASALKPKQPRFLIPYLPERKDLVYVNPDAIKVSISRIEVEVEKERNKVEALNAATSKPKTRPKKVAITDDIDSELESLKGFTDSDGKDGEGEKNSNVAATFRRNLALLRKSVNINGSESELLLNGISVLNSLLTEIMYFNREIDSKFDFFVSRENWVTFGHLLKTMYGDHAEAVFADFSYRPTEVDEEKPRYSREYAITTFRGFNITPDMSRETAFNYIKSESLKLWNYHTNGQKISKLHKFILLDLRKIGGYLTYSYGFKGYRDTSFIYLFDGSKVTEKNVAQTITDMLFSTNLISDERKERIKPSEFSIRTSLGHSVVSYIPFIESTETLEVPADYNLVCRIVVENKRSISYIEHLNPFSFKGVDTCISLDEITYLSKRGLNMHFEAMKDHSQLRRVKLFRTPKEGNLDYFFEFVKSISENTGQDIKVVLFDIYMRMVHPTKPRPQMLFVGRQGTGKSVYAAVLATLTPGDYTVIQNDDLNTNFKYFLRSKTVIVNEVKDKSDKRDKNDSDRKNWQITDPNGLNVQVKHRGDVTKYGHTNIIMCSNHIDAVRVEAGDNRLVVWEFSKVFTATSLTDVEILLKIQDMIPAILYYFKNEYECPFTAAELNRSYYPIEYTETAAKSNMRDFGDESNKLVAIQENVVNLVKDIYLNCSEHVKSKIRASGFTTDGENLSVSGKPCILLTFNDIKYLAGLKTHRLNPDEKSVLEHKGIYHLRKRSIRPQSYNLLTLNISGYNANTYENFVALLNTPNGYDEYALKPVGKDVASAPFIIEVPIEELNAVLDTVKNDSSRKSISVKTAVVETAVVETVDIDDCPF